jgi:predicted NAD/FAD-dependent oxidoreductase
MDDSLKFHLEEQQADVLIVGAGIAGLVAATQLQQRELRVTVLEKEQSVGGRMATFRVGSGRADAGAQFFTVRTADFRRLVVEWLQAGVVYEWARGWSDGSPGGPVADGYPRYAVTGGMATIPQRLAQGLNVCTEVRIREVTTMANGWQATDEKGNIYQGRALLLTSPVPQSLALLAAGKIALANSDQRALASTVYAPCLCGLFAIEGGVHLPEPGALHRPGAPVSWLADNQRKGISPATILTVHASPEYSRQLWAAPPAEVLAVLQAALWPYVERTAVITEQQLIRWPYALPIRLYPERYLLAATFPPLLFAGDAFNGPKVEGAALSGMAAAEVIEKALHNPTGT